ncbi:CinA family protein, partial [Weissella soli]|uniref:CinA family protein n=1 Tax=Weissella soli TaxID=155866 RepID=UPI0035A0A47F
VSFTGVAGPDELEGQPAGTVFIAIIDDHDEVHIAQGHFAHCCHSIVHLISKYHRLLNKESVHLNLLYLHFNIFQ